MKCIFILMDSLNRSAVPPCGTQELPNFARLAARSTVFDNHYVGSMPCMPARRDIHTGRLNFLHRGWGPLEPFDVSFAEVLRKAGIYSHLITDHYHYFEDGGFGFHGRYDSYEFIRGQEKDKWRSTIAPGLDRYQDRFDPSQRDLTTDPNGKAAYYASHRALAESAQFPLTQCFDAALDFVEDHAATDDWFLQLECFDPHEPLFLGEDDDIDMADGQESRIFDWLKYGRNDLPAKQLDELQSRYARLVERCDDELGRLLDLMDARSLWDDTVVILTTDHGLLLGEKEFLGKNRPPFFNEVARIPLMIAAPPTLTKAPRRVPGLTQTTDLMPTFLDLFGCVPPSDISGKSLLPCLREEADGTHEAVIFGQFGAALNYADASHSCFRYPRPDAGDLFQYTLMPTHMRSHFEASEFEDAEVVNDLAYARGFPVWRLRMQPNGKANMVARYPLLDAEDALFDLEHDPDQATPLDDPNLMDACHQEMSKLLTYHGAPAEMFTRFGLKEL